MAKSTFGSRFNQWLIEQGREPYDDEIIAALDGAAASTMVYMQENKDAIVKGIQGHAQGIVDDVQAGRDPHPEQRARELAAAVSGE